ncbi:addiction module antidote protein, HigA family [Marinobacter lutaoensis]|uniref:Addiction module antidote protein, HigA family n=1 Tax=Marinobacter lutaoensis TaxID=135739 RepID=A0A1V2DPJ5_9GAMM|nr:HigA family addiction module antitoxin [Marinobacter lutaoensis]ONF42554.1 addiction module antidote protein, HigA family [Marinobacter lutaoensis]
MRRVDYSIRERIRDLKDEFLTQCPVKEPSGVIVHPGHILDRFMSRMSTSIADLSRHTGMSRATIHRIVREKGRITRDIAIRLEVCFGLPASFFLVQQAHWDCQEGKKDSYSDVKPMADSVISQYALGLILADLKGDEFVSPLFDDTANEDDWDDTDPATEVGGLMSG